MLDNKKSQTREKEQDYTEESEGMKGGTSEMDMDTDIDTMDDIEYTTDMEE